MTRNLEAMMTRGRDTQEASVTVLAANEFNCGASLCSAPHNYVLCEEKKGILAYEYCGDINDGPSPSKYRIQTLKHTGKTMCL